MAQCDAALNAPNRSEGQGRADHSLKPARLDSDRGDRVLENVKLKEQTGQVAVVQADLAGEPSAAFDIFQPSDWPRPRLSQLWKELIIADWCQNCAKLFAKMKKTNEFFREILVNNKH